MKIKKAIYITAGCLGVVLGAIGAAVPLIPAFPFLLLAAVCFGKSSERLHTWFTGTELYKKNLESYVQGRGMCVGVPHYLFLLRNQDAAGRRSRAV